MWLLAISKRTNRTGNIKLHTFVFVHTDTHTECHAVSKSVQLSPPPDRVTSPKSRKYNNDSYKNKNAYHIFCVYCCPRAGAIPLTINWPIFAVSQKSRTECDWQIPSAVGFQYNSWAGKHKVEQEKNINQNNLFFLFVKCCFYWIIFKRSYVRSRKLLYTSDAPFH